MNRQQWRRFERQFRKLLETKGNKCSLCGTGFEHNVRTFGGYDQSGRVVIVGECCVERLQQAHTVGLYSHHRYDFIRRGESTNSSYDADTLAQAVDAYQQAIADADETVKDVQKHSGVNLSRGQISVLDSSWKDADRDWFERYPARTHRARWPFPGEVEALGCGPLNNPLMLIRQVEPGKRIKVPFLGCHELPPDSEALMHALFEVAVGNEPLPHNSTAMVDLVKKYTTSSEAG
jgi:hypothetical protein